MGSAAAVTLAVGILQLPRAMREGLREWVAVLSDAAWVWLSPLLILAGCMGLLWAFRSLLQRPAAAAVGASKIRHFWNKLQRIEVFGFDVSLILGYSFVVVPLLLLMFAFIAIAATVALAGFFKLAEVTGLGALLEYVDRSLDR